MDKEKILNSLVAKCNTDEGSVEEKLRRGFTRLEIQLLDPEFDVVPVLGRVKGRTHDIVSVHSPLFEREDISITGITLNSAHHAIFTRTCQLAQELAVYYGHPMKVIIHNSISGMAYLKKNDLFTEILLAVMRETLGRFPDITILMENVTPLAYLSDVNDVTFRQGSKAYETVGVAETLNNVLETDRFGTVFDTCHFMMTKQQLTLFSILCNNTEFAGCIPVNFKSEYRTFADTVSIVHLSSMIGSGMEHGQHGTAFDEKDRVFLKAFFEEYDKYDNKPDIVLKIAELDYSNCIAVSQAKEMIGSVLSEM